MHRGGGHDLKEASVRSRRLRETSCLLLGHPQDCHWGRLVEERQAEVGRPRGAPVWGNVKAQTHVSRQSHRASQQCRGRARCHTTRHQDPEGEDAFGVSHTPEDSLYNSEAKKHSGDLLY